MAAASPFRECISTGCRQHWGQDMGHRSHISNLNAGCNQVSRPAAQDCNGLPAQRLFANVDPGTGAAAQGVDVDIASLQGLMAQLLRCGASLDVETGCEVELALCRAVAMAGWTSLRRH